MENLVEVNDLRRSYRVWHRGAGLSDLFRSLGKRHYSEIRALDGVSFSIDRGEIVGFLGPNGAGKSTAIKILCGVLYPSSGEVRVNGLIPWVHRTRHVAQIGAVFGQKSQLIWDISPEDSFRMNRAIYGLSKSEYRETLEELVNLLEVESIIRRPTRTLSLGERMKCEFIMAMLHRPHLVFLDEPTIGLDVMAKESIRRFIQEMNQRGTTFVLTTHDLADIEFLASRVLVINHGKLVMDDDLAGLKRLYGQRKQLRLVSDQSPVLGDVPGLVEVSRQDRTVTWNLDLGLSSLDDVMRRLGVLCTIQDLQVTDVPIESIVKAIYQE